MIDTTRYLGYESFYRSPSLIDFVPTIVDKTRKPRHFLICLYYLNNGRVEPEGYSVRNSYLKSHIWSDVPLVNSSSDINKFQV